MYQYFTEKEFNAIGCSLSDMDEDFMQKLDRIRKICNFPFHINSAYRSKESELKKGRNGLSSHCKGVAVDIKALKDSEKYLIVQTAMSQGITRIGIAKNYIHLDADKEKNQNVIWTY
jgi:uncharacterized protein YcbK (DUF882 family)